MITKNSWIQTNIKQRFIDKTCKFEVHFKLYNFREMSFRDAAEYTCLEIYKEHKNLFLGLSGGMDSEYVLRVFHRLNIPIQPVIVCCGNEKENEFAYKLCDELQVEPIVINITEEDFLRFFVKKIYNKIGGTAYNSTQTLFAQEYAFKNNGILIAGEHLIYEDKFDIISDTYMRIPEWDVYGSCHFDGNIINFFCYTPELVYSSLPKLGTQSDIYRAEIYQIKWRDKITANYSEELMSSIKKVIKQQTPNKHTHIFTRNECFGMFRKFLIKNEPI